MRISRGFAGIADLLNPISRVATDCSASGIRRNYPTERHVPGGCLILNSLANYYVSKWLTPVLHPIFWAYLEGVWVLTGVFERRKSPVSVRQRGLLQRFATTSEP